MGDAQSAQRENKKDAAAEEESGKVDDAPAEQNTDDKPLKNNGQISEINGKADSTIAEVNGHCEDEIAAEGEDVPETTKSLKEEDTPVENVEINENESPNEVDDNEEMIEMDSKQNDINESFRRFFSNIGLKLTVKRGSAEKAEIETDVPDETNEEESNRLEYIEGTAKETKSEDTEQNIDLTTAQETYDNDSTTCPTLTDATSEDILENAEVKATEAKEVVGSENVDAATTSPVHEDEKAQQDATLEEDLHPTSPSSPEPEVVVSPIKRFFTTGIFSGLRKKKRPTEDETTDKELVEMGKETVETAEIQQNKEEISLGVEADTVETENKENKLKEEMNDGKSPPTDAVSVTVDEPEIMSSQEKVQASPLKRLLSGSSLKKHSKKQRGRKSSDAKLSDSGEHFSDQLMSSNESAEHQKEESPVQHPVEAAGEEDGAWASFKKLVTPKKRMKTSSLTKEEETQITGSVEETKPSEGEQISDHSTEDGKKRKDSSVSWEAVLCGSGRRRSRSRKTSDSEDEMPQVENDNKKQDSPLESSNEVDEILAISPKQVGSPSEVDGGSTWKSLKKLVTPKRKAKNEEESKDNLQSDSEVAQDDSSFSIKNLLPGRKKRKSAEKQDQVSSDEADKEAASGEEDSETPAVVPLSEFDTIETEVHIETQADVESHVPKEADYELQQDLLDQMAEPVLPCDSLQTEVKKVQDNEDTLENEASTTPASDEEPEDLTELISKHQQLSDIPEEGIITETMATPASVTEDTARDDTIADDLIEMTSEAITALEPVDITLTDETEMISAVSQLSESSKTSGNTTPVPVEYDIKHTEALLHEVVETICISPKAAPLCSDEISSERIVGSVSHQILESFVKEEPAILKIHRRSDATAIKIGLNAEELDVITELAATVQTESISEVNEGVSTEIVSEVPTVEFDNAKIVVDEVHEVNVLHPEESIKELESTDESQHQVESQSEVDEAEETLSECEEIVADEGSLVDEKEPLQIDCQEVESAVTVAEETKDGSVEQQVQTLTQKDDEILHNITDQVQVEDKDQPPVEVEELQELAAAQAAKLESEEGCVQLLEKEVISEDIPATETITHEPIEKTKPLTEDNVEAEKEDELQADAAETEHIDEPEVAAVTHESKHEVHLSAVVASVEGEKEGELEAAVIKSAAVEHAVVTQVITCHLKDVSTTIPDVLIEKTSDIHEPLINTLVSEIEFEETVMSATPLVKDEVIKTAEEGSVIMMMNVPSVQFEDNHRIQVQVVDVDVKSAETIVDTALEVGVTETKEVIDVCNETVKEVDTLSATSKTEELINKESKVTIQEVIQHVKEKVPETVPESVLVNLEQKVMKQPDAVTEESEIAEQQVLEDLTQTPDIPGSLDVSVHDCKEDFEEPKDEINEESPIPQIAQSQIVTPSNSGVIVPQNTGIVSSIGNVESPSSLSLEFKLNIQFGQARAPVSPPPATERIETVKKTDVSEVGVQVVEPEKQIDPTQNAEGQKQTELTEVAVQATEITEPEPTNINSTDRAVIMNQPVLLDVGMQAMETGKPVEQIKSTDRVTPNVQATETIQTVRQTEKTEMFLSQPVLSEACDQETKAKEPVKQTEEENDQDVWLDAEEDIYTQGESEVPLHEEEERLEQQTESDRDKKAVPQHELEMASNFKIEEEESQQEMLIAGATCEIESEGEDFAVALEHPETATATITKMEWD
ncbi:A-kinase anchor protein 12-like [Seriola dumerili]|uniref:A-kinase anchor protein 12-like n=1 Tax=Seriola dumerili TaxID=41447 RepID=UPI000BBEFD8F|nr:A-kinase anchor protein 12-like [Seriola dumerili]